ncbi:MAG: hypothetical protein IJ741_00540 [Schwartzia sp.]|nr:hypothetical protein [Schwartzia sp. (in: firmicutes)]
MATDNVYRKIEVFYQRRKQLNKLVRKARMERYFREMAWKGKSDALLQRVFGVVSAMLSYMARHRLESFYLLTRYDFLEIFYCYADVRPKLRLIEQNVNMFFDYLEAFLRAMTDGDSEVMAALEEGRALFCEGGIFSMPERLEYDEFCDLLEHTEEIGEAELDHLNALLDGLVAGMIEYFQRDEMRPDFARAVSLYAGPFIEADKADENWWMGFWDYFFFDYHCKEDDTTPVHRYLEKEKSRLSAEERYVLRDLSHAKLTVFTVNYLDEDFAVCTDLFSGEELELPCPDVTFADYKNMIFFGHLQRRGVMLLNYITGLSASQRLQKRIRDEINKQYERFKTYQMPQATLADFFTRHAAAVRHTVQILSGFAQLRVVPDLEGKPASGGAVSAELFEPEETRLEQAAFSLRFSAYSIVFVKRLYEDYVSTAKRRGTSTVLAAALLLVEGINGVEYAPLGDLLSVFGVERDAVFRAVNEIGVAVDCVAFDPRYLTEEGYVQLLYLV